MEYKKITTSERKCNSCGFVTFSLCVLYKHKHKCQGKLLGSPHKCAHCKRKFIFPFILKQHLKTCVKRNKKKKVSKLRSEKKNKLTNGFTVSKKSIIENKPSTIACPVCMKFFNSRSLYDAHEKSGNCGPQVEVKEKAASARKSFQKTPPRYKRNKYISESSDSDSSFVSDNLLSDIVERNRKFIKSGRGYSCIRCKKAYPAKVILLKHLDSNYKCALAHFEQDFFQKKFAKARKSVHHVVARKSFSRSYPNSYQLSKSMPKLAASARKSLSNSFLKQQFKPHSVKQSSIITANQCPVCHEKFPNPFTFYQHQKMYHHWGKATKTINLSCKCPFCLKEFFSVRARNAHIRNHADQTDQKIEAFLKSTTCDICSQVFVSEILKLQHLKIEHSKKQNSRIVSGSTDILVNDGSKYVALPLAIKQQLKQYPNECPICAERYATLSDRNDHFEEIHLNSELACQFCPIKGDSEDLVDEHMKRFHYDQFKYECFVCKDKFPSVAHVVGHVKKLHPAHDPKNKQQSAVKSFNQQSLRVSEAAKFQRNESQEKDQGYFCDICNLTFPKLQLLRRHEQTKEHCDTLVKNLDAVHESLSNLPPSPPVLPKTVATPENITCSECFVEFTKLKDFVPHRLSHFGEKEKYMEINEENTYTCEICGDVSDSHSKVQIHLFWHLQVESSTKEKKISDISKSNPIISSRSSTQHVAKKSFGKPTQTHQEVIIGGIKKHLFTCDSCKIGFTDQTHYNVHIRKFCRMKNNPISNKSKEEIAEPSKSRSALSSSALSKPVKREPVSVEIMLCYQCCSIFNRSIKHIHDKICSKCKKSHLEPSANVFGFKTSIKLRKAVAACLKCDCLFLTTHKFVEHMISIHGLPKENKIPVDKEKNISTNEKEIPIIEEKEVSVNEVKEIELNEENDTSKIKEIDINKDVEIKEIDINKDVEIKEIDINKDVEIKEIDINEEMETSVNKEKEILVHKEEEVVNKENLVDKEITVNEEISMNEENQISINEENEISIHDENTLVLGGDYVIHCTTCNFIFFSTDILGEHEKTCTKFSYSNSRLENYTPEFKAALEENAIISSCLNCDLAFNSAQDLTEHLESHQKNPTSTEQGDSEVTVPNETSIQEEKMDTGESVSENTSISTPEVLNSQSTIDVPDLLPNAQIDSLINDKDISIVSADAPNNSLQGKKIDDIDSLRKNFSQLLSILVSDPDLMQQLGYGELLVDEVLVNVLQTMEQTPVLKDEKTTDLDCLRQNIQILLEFCLEDQIMALIGDGKTSTDDVVIEALKIFGGESSMSIVALE